MHLVALPHRAHVRGMSDELRLYHSTSLTVPFVSNYIILFSCVHISGESLMNCTIQLVELYHFCCTVPLPFLLKCAIFFCLHMSGECLFNCTIQKCKRDMNFGKAIS